MKHLIIYTHLNPKSFSRAVADEAERAAKAKGHETRFIDLYADKFNPVLEFPDIQYSFMGGDAPEDVKAYQEHVSWADHLTFVYPLWWEQMPAMLKGFIDRVFTNGFAFTYGEDGAKGLFPDKSVQLFINTGSSSEDLIASGIQPAIQKYLEEGVFSFCGMSSTTTFFGGVTGCSQEQREAYLASIESILP